MGLRRACCVVACIGVTAGWTFQARAQAKEDSELDVQETPVDVVPDDESPLEVDERQPLPDRPREDGGGEADGSATDQGQTTVGGAPAAEETREILETEPRPDRPREGEVGFNYDVAGFDKGELNPFYIQSRGGRFRLNVGAYTEFRYTANLRQTPPEGEGEDKYEGGFAIPRTRLFFEGLFSPGIAFHLQIGVSDTGEFSLIDAHGDVNFGELLRRNRTRGFWLLRLGRFFRAVSRENWMFALDLLGVDYTGVETVLGVGNGDGAQMFYAADRYRTWFAVTADARDSTATFPSEATNVSVSSRSEFQVGKSDWSNWTDTIGRRGRAFGVLFGAAAEYQYSQADGDLNTGKHSGSVTADISFSGNGFQTLTYGEVSWERIDGELQYVWGFVTQGGYFVNKMWQLYAEYDHLNPGNLEGFSNYNVLSLGSNVFPFEWTNKYRVTVEGGLLFNPLSDTLVPPTVTLGWLPAVSGNQYRIRIQFVFGF